MKSRTNQLLKAMHVVSWIVFIGLCIKTGAILTSFLISHFVNPEAASDIYLKLDLSSLMKISLIHYNTILLLMIFISALKAYLFYIVIKIFKQINLMNPFSIQMSLLIKKMSIISLIIGLLSIMGYSYSIWIITNKVSLFNLPSFLIGGAEFVFFAGILFITSLIFRKGIEYQDELEETV
jgi:hypothetical protein